MAKEVEPLETRNSGATPDFTSELSGTDFEGVREIGRGGFGIVYRCMQPALDRTVAVKVLTVGLDDENRARFFREQRAMGRLSGHPNIVTVFQVGSTDNSHPYIVMQYHPQGSLDVQIRRFGPLPLDETLRLGVKMAGAVETAHRLGILHRDIKPANILLTVYGEPALTDFGIAHISGGFETVTGTVTGTVAFTAPEVLNGAPTSPASDIYSLGATLFSALSGHAAFERRRDEQVVAQFIRITSQPVPDLRKKGIPDEVCEIIERAMSADPRDRLSTAADFGNELRQVQMRSGYLVDDMALPSTSPSTSDDLGDHNRATGVARVTKSRPRPSAAVPPMRNGMRNFPLELTSFIGRHHELSEVKAMLSVSRLVTLTGIGGVGKTRLALRAAAEVRKRFADGVRLVELGELREESLLLELVAAALRLTHHSTRLVEDVIVDFLASQRLLLVLDNCEHLLDGVAEFAQILLRTCPDLKILATSREPLGIGGEAVLRVPPLSVPNPRLHPSLPGMPRYDAVALFVERAAAVVSGFELTEDNRLTVTGICCQLDGLPLPIELAAARLRAMSAEQILQRLTDRYKLLTTGGRGAPTRQQTLQLCIDWSYELCTPREKRLWTDLSVFAGSFELDAAEGICSSELTPEDLLDSLASLVDKSILLREGQGEIVRFQMLETLREYGRAKAQQAGGYREHSRHHRDWYRQLVVEAEDDWISPRQLKWLSRLEQEQPNLRAAIEFSLTDVGDVGNTDIALQIAAGLFPFWLSRNLLTEGRYWLERSLARPPARPTGERVKALYAASVLAEVQGDLPAGRMLIEAGHTAAAAIGDPVTDARIAHAEGLLALYSGDLPLACSRLEDALEVFGSRGDLSLEVFILMMLGLAYTLQGDMSRASICQQRALSVTEFRGESVYRSYALWAMAVALFRQEEYGRAVRLLKQCLRLTVLVDEPVVAAQCVEVLAWIACREQTAQRGAKLMGAAEALAAAVGCGPVLFRDLLGYHDECKESARHALGIRGFESLHRKGKALGVEEAVTYALGEQTQAVLSPSHDAPKLTNRERQVADLVARGLTNKAIAAKLVISQRTAQGHVEHILAKLGFTSRAQIAAWVVEHNAGQS